MLIERVLIIVAPVILLAKQKIEVFQFWDFVFATLTILKLNADLFSCVKLSYCNKKRTTTTKKTTRFKGSLHIFMQRCTYIA